MGGRKILEALDGPPVIRTILVASLLIVMIIDRHQIVESAALVETDHDQANKSSIKNQQSDAKTTAYLRKYGYIESNKAAGGLVSLSHLSEAISNFQKLAGLRATGVADEKTLQMMDMPRCGNPDKLGKEPKRVKAGLLRSGPIRKRRYVLEGSKHRSRQLTYRIEKYPSRRELSRNDVDVQIKRAFDLWSKHAQINFTIQKDGKADININFYRKRHADCEDVFDGRGSELAHASPPIDESDVHFDDQEHWAIDKEDTDIFTVAAHEFGHALGILHSTNNESLMAPFYKYLPNLELHSDDIAAIQDLYGVRKRNDLPVDLCQDSTIDAITQTQDGNVYVFKDEFYWLLTDDGYARGYPHLIGADWAGLPGSLDAALTSIDGKTLFFQGDKYWRFQNMKPDLGNPHSITKDFEGMPINIDAAFVWSQDQQVYFFKGDKYWRYEANSNANPNSKSKVGNQYPRTIAYYWRGVPSDLSDAFTWKGNQTFFFKGGQYYRFNNEDDEVDTTTDIPFPRRSAYWWFGCGASKSV